MTGAQIATNALYKHAKDQIDPIDAVQGLEIQDDVVLFTLQNLIADVQAYSGTGKITLSVNTTNGLAALQLFAAKSSVAAADIAAASTNKVIQSQITLKGLIRNLQMAYYAAKARLGLS